MNPLVYVAAVGAGVALAFSPTAADAPLAGVDLESTPMTPNFKTSPEDNVSAFLAVIRQGESSDNYRALVGGGEFRDTTDHPAVLGTFKGIKTRDGQNISTAAGAYQITRRTWLDISGKARFGSFNNAAQDQAALFLIDRRGAMEAIRQGRIDDAHRLLKNEWEFLTLPRWTVSKTEDAFSNFGGEVMV